DLSRHQLTLFSRQAFSVYERPVSGSEIADDYFGAIHENLAMFPRKRGVLDAKQIAASTPNSRCLAYKFINVAVQLLGNERQLWHGRFKVCWRRTEQNYPEMLRSPFPGRSEYRRVPNPRSARNPRFECFRSDAPAYPCLWRFETSRDFPA